jgi:hypothetical protein
VVIVSIVVIIFVVLVAVIKIQAPKNKNIKACSTYIGQVLPEQSGNVHAG